MKLRMIGLACAFAAALAAQPTEVVLHNFGSPPRGATPFSGNSLACRQWLDKVARGPSRVPTEQPAAEGGSKAVIVTPASDPWGIASLADVDRLEAMRCLLEAENDLRPAAISGAVRLDVSQTFAPAQVNLAALYAISYIYTGRYDHSAAVALRGEDASSTDSRGSYVVTNASAVHRAYKAYRAWFTSCGVQRGALAPPKGANISSRWPTKRQ